MYIYDHKFSRLPNQGEEQSVIRPHLAALSLGLAADLPRVTAVKLVNRGKSHPDNCAVACRNMRHGRCELGVGVDGTGANFMELQFTITGHRDGFTYDIKRTRRNSLWERRGGVWTRLEYQPTGTLDDHANDDECRIPERNRIFAVDRPGFVRTRLPALAGHLFTTAPRVYTHVDATEVVLRASFDEWVNARPSESVDWTPIGPDPHVFWHNIIWMTRNAKNEWVLDKARSEIELGSLAESVITSAPT
jgi:hypothetical protein